MGTTLELWPGLARQYFWTILGEDGQPLDLTPYSQIAVGIDEEKDAIDLVTKLCTKEQTGAGSDEDPFVNKGLVSFKLVAADTASWPASLRNRLVRHQFIAKKTSDGEWYPCRGPDPCLVHDRVFDTLPA